jgi:hypothetical protein
LDATIIAIIRQSQNFGQLPFRCFRELRPAVPVERRVKCKARAGHVRKGNGTAANQKRKPPMKAKSSRFDSLVARYYPAVYNFASRLTDDPREAIALTRNAFRSAQKQLCSLRDQTAVATTLTSAVIRAGQIGIT